MTVDYRKVLKVANDQHEAAKDATRRARDIAVLAAFEAGVTQQEIATICDMSYGNVRKICREERERAAAVAPAKKPRGR